MILWIMGAACIVATLFVILARVMPLKLILGYATVVDIIFSVGMFALFHGTVTGLMSATLAGLMLAVTLSIGRWAFGYQRISFRRVGVGFTLEIITTEGRIACAMNRMREWTTRVMTGLTATYAN